MYKVVWGGACLCMGDIIVPLAICCQVPHGHDTTISSLTFGDTEAICRITSGAMRSPATGA